MKAALGALLLARAMYRKSTKIGWDPFGSGSPPFQDTRF